MASLPTLLAHEERRRDDEAALLHRAQQARQVEMAEARLAQARAVLLAQEQRCAAVHRLIERRAAELLRNAQRHDQKHTDELAQRLHWQRQAAAVPQP